MIIPDMYSIIRRIASRLLLVLMAVSTLCHAANSAEGAPKLDIPANPALARYLDLLEYPPYLGLALENTGFKTSYSGKLMILDEHAAQISNVALGNIAIEPTVRFSSKKGAVFSYEAGVMNASIPVTIDASSIKNGVITIVFPASSGSIVPSMFYDVIGEKILLLANADVQQRMVKYLDGIVARKPEGRNEKEWIASQILLEGYNKRASASGESTPGVKSTPFSWWMLLLGVAVAAVAYFKRDRIIRRKQPS